MNKIYVFLLGLLLSLSLVAAQSYNSNMDLRGYGVDANVDADVNVKNVKVNSDGTVDADIDVKTNVKGTVDGQAIDSTSDANYKVSGNANDKIEVQGTVKNSDGSVISQKTLIDLKNKSVNAGDKFNLSNGKNVEVKIMPSTASQTAIERLQIKVCSEQNNCTIILKEVGNGDKAQLVYEVKAEKNFKVLALFKAKAEVNAQVNVESGAVVDSNGPWWSFIASSSD